MSRSSSRSGRHQGPADDARSDDEAESEPGDVGLSGEALEDEDLNESPAATQGELVQGGEAIRLTVEARAHGWRVDHYLARLFPNFSRGQFQKAIEGQAVEVNGLPVKMSRRLHVNDVVSVRLPARADETLQPENIPLEIVFEDEHLVVINKAAGLITHPGKGNYGGTLANALQFHFDNLSSVAGRFRPGVVHRLDRDTSGIIVVAKNNQVHNHLSAQFEQREVRKEYRAIAWGVVEQNTGLISTHMRVHPKQREKMMVCEPGGNSREATTQYEVLERFYDFTYVRLLPRTGRTHQLRVHMRHLGHPLVADQLYGGREVLSRGYLVNKRTGGVSGQAAAHELDPAKVRPEDQLIVRQALHAFRLEFRHPATRQPLAFEAPLPTDMQATLDQLRETN